MGLNSPEPETSESHLLSPSVALWPPLSLTHTHTGRFHLWCDTSLKLNLLSRDLLWSDETSCSFWEWAVNHYTGLDRHTLECVCMNNELLTLLRCIDIITCMKAFPMCVWHRTKLWLGIWVLNVTLILTSLCEQHEEL